MSDDDEMEDFEVNDEDLRRAMDPSYRNKSPPVISVFFWQRKFIVNF
jgi:hypothetical protein